MHEQTAVVRLPLEGPIFALVENWRRSQPKIPSRNEAIRLLLRQALERSSEKSEATVDRRRARGRGGVRGVICRGSANGVDLDDPP